MDESPLVVYASILRYHDQGLWLSQAQQLLLVEAINMGTVQDTCEQAPKPRRLPIELVVLVCFIGIAAGGLFGHLAGDIYAANARMDARRHDPQAAHSENGYAHILHRSNMIHRIGLATGVVGGLLAGVLWCRRVTARMGQGGALRVIMYGTCWGVISGCIATVLLHLVLWIASRSPDPMLLVLGLIAAVATGLVAGAICGGITAISIKRPQENQ